MKNKNETYSETMDVTPEMAKGFLSKEAKNRPIAQRRVDRYTRDMREGRWHATGQGASIGINGELYDAGHRMRAIVQSGVTVRMTITFNVTEEARLAIDRGKSRSVADILHMFRGVDHSKAVAAWANSICIAVFDTRVALEAEDIKDWLDVVQADVNAMIEMYKLVPKGMRQKIGQSSVFGALVFARRHDPEAVDAFTYQLATGEGISAGDPAHTLREYLLAGGAAAQNLSDKRALSLKTLRAAQYHCEGKGVRKLMLGEEGLRFFVESHTYLSIPAPFIGGSSEAAEADRKRYETVRGMKTMAPIVAALRASGLDDDAAAKWCVDFRSYVPALLLYVPAQIKQMAIERLAGSARRSA